MKCNSFQLQSWYYHRRSPFRIHGAKRDDPNFELTNEFHPDTIDMSFESCVLKGYEECQFIPYSDSNDLGGHRGLIAHFCGHEKVRFIFVLCFYSNTLCNFERLATSLYGTYRRSKAIIGILRHCFITHKRPPLH